MLITLDLLHFVRCTVAKIADDNSPNFFLINETGCVNVYYQGEIKAIARFLSEGIHKAGGEIMIRLLRRDNNLVIEFASGFGDLHEFLIGPCEFAGAVNQLIKPVKIESGHLFSRSKRWFKHLRENHNVIVVEDNHATEGIHVYPNRQNTIPTASGCQVLNVVEMKNIANYASGDDFTLFFPFFDTDLVIKLNRLTERKKYLVLVADDSIPSQVATKVMLEKLGCDVVNVGDGNEALNRATQQVFDIIFLDERMPGLYGSEVARQLASSSGLNQNTPKVSLTGVTEPEKVASLFEKGITHYIEKPVSKLALEKFLKQIQPNS